MLILVAGNQTTTNLLGMLLMRLAQDPDLFAQLRADRSLLPAAVEETARWGPRCSGSLGLPPPTARSVTR